MVTARHNVAEAEATAFEAGWIGRELALRDVPGFVDFALLKGALKDGARDFLIRTLWQAEADYQNWRGRGDVLADAVPALPAAEAGGYTLVARLGRDGRVEAAEPAAAPVVDLRERLRLRFEGNADGVIETLAAEHGLTPLAATRLLPESRCRWTEGTRFEAVMAELSRWGAVLFLVHTPSVILEVKGEIPPGEAGRGFFNLHGESPIGGHLRASRCTDIAFVRRPFMGLDSASVQFFDEDGAAMFKVYVRRNADRSLDQEQLARFEAAARDFSRNVRQVA